MRGIYRVLILCSGNSCRSQMAEAWFNHLAPQRFRAFSAGVEPAGFVHPLTIQAMAEVGIDIRQARSKSVAEFIGHPFDFVITVCDPAAAACPTFPGPSKRIHWPTDDPFAVRGDPETRLAAYRRTRDELRGRIEDLMAACPLP